MANTVSIRERIKTPDGRWVWTTKIPVPEGKLKAAEAERKGKFYLVWTDNGKKREQKVKSRLSTPRGLAEETFDVAVKAARAKERHLEDTADGYSRPDPLQPIDRKTIADSIERYLERVEISQAPLTLKAYKQTLHQFGNWTTLMYMDQIDHDHVMAFRKHVGKCNGPLTADWKAFRVNKFVKSTLGLADGNGPIKKSDLGRMKPNGAPQIYSNAEITGFFQACKPHENLRYTSLYEPAFRKKELMFLEREDVLVQQQMLRVQSKIRYDQQGKLMYEFKAKANSEREVPISKTLMDRIVNYMNKPARREFRLVFCTNTGRPDTHLWDKLQPIAKRVGMRRFNLKKFRATRATEWLRPKWLGGCGYDIPTVKNLLGHDRDGDSIWSYVRHIDNEVLVAKMNKESE